MDGEIAITELTDPTLEDLAGMNRLIPQLSRSAAPLHLAMLKEICADPDVELYLARHQGRIVGSLTLLVFHIPTGSRAIIEDVVVDEELRGRDIGASLVRHGLGRAQLRGARTVDLTSRPDRVAANRLYLKLGFVARSTNVYRFAIDN